MKQRPSFARKRALLMVLVALVCSRYARGFRTAFVRPISSFTRLDSRYIPSLLCHIQPPGTSQYQNCRPSLRRYATTAQTQSPLASTKAKANEKETDPFEECWKASSWTVNPWNDTAIDQILQTLHSPAPHSFHIIHRALKQIMLRLANQDESVSQQGSSLSSSVQETLEQCAYLVKPGYCFVIPDLAVDASSIQVVNVPGKGWNVTTVSDALPAGWTAIVPKPRYNNTLQIANEALALVTSASQNNKAVNETEIEHLVDLCEERLQLTLGTDIRGRTAADTAFTLALAGVTRTSLYLTLTKIARLEFERVGRRPSRRPKDILQSVEKLAAAGIRGAEVDEVYRVAADCLAAKTEQQHLHVVETLRSALDFDLLSARPLLWLWRFSARQTKARNETATEETDALALRGSEIGSGSWLQGYTDTSRPLVVDIGCGLGVSLLGLASLKHADRESELSIILGGANSTDCNYLGGDLSQLAIRFGQGIASRWDLNDRLQFTYAAAEDLLDEIDSVYQGPIALILIQFPTPYRLVAKEGGNMQLPNDLRSGFMASERVMKQAASLLKKSGGGRLLLQSNCEDVAVAMRNIAKEAGMKCIDSVHPVTSLDDGGRPQQRTQEWIRLGGERAIGPEWSSVSPLPMRCATETEVACELQGTPVHRCLMEV